jgi:oligosaccharide repeat unit polymerase
MIAAVTCALSLWVLVVLNWARSRDILYPGVIQPAAWAAQATVFCFYSTEMAPVSAVVWLIILYGAVAFSLGTLFSTARLPRPREVQGFHAVPRRWVVWGGLFLMCVFVVPATVEKAIQMSRNGPFVSGWANLRYGASYTEGYGTLKYGFTACYVLLAAQYARWLSSHSRGNMVVLGLASLTALIMLVCSSSRGVFILVGLLLVVMYATYHRGRSVRAITSVAAVGFVVFVVLGVLTYKLATTSAGPLGVLGQGMVSLRQYFLGPLPAFSIAVANGSPLEMGVNTLRTVRAILAALGSDVHVSSLVLPFVLVPYPTNLYTVYMPYYLDFGIYVLPVVQLLFGVLHGLLYARYRSSSSRIGYALLFGLSLYALVFQWGGDFYFSLLSTWMQFVIYASILNVLAEHQVPCHDELR